MTYIKRENALNAFNNAFYSGLAAKIKEIPSEDVAPVRHGRWIEQGLSPYEGTRRCSICESYYDIKEQFNYCPNCGAKMDGGDTDEID